MSNVVHVHPVPYSGQAAPAPTYPTAGPIQPAYPPPPAYPAPAYQQQQQPSYAVQVQPQQQTQHHVVVVQQPTVVVGTGLPRFTQSRAWLICPHCHNNVQTTVHYKIGGFAWLVAAVLFFVGLSLGCCLIPFCVDSCKDVEHTCPSCHRMLGKFHRL